MSLVGYGIANYSAAAFIAIELLVLVRLRSSHTASTRNGRSCSSIISDVVAPLQPLASVRRWRGPPASVIRISLASGQSRQRVAQVALHCAPDLFFRLVLAAWVLLWVGILRVILHNRGSGRLAWTRLGYAVPIVGTLVRSMRLAAGLSQGALAERAGLSEKAIGALERGDAVSVEPSDDLRDFVILVHATRSLSLARETSTCCLPCEVE